MATYRGNQDGRSPHASAAAGNAWLANNKVIPAAALATTDTVVGLSVPAGVLLSGLRYRNGDFDTGTTLTVNVGYRTLLPGGSQTNLTAFGSALTTLQAAQTAWAELVFDPIKFNEPVEIVFTPAAAATGVSGTPALTVQATGEVVGVS